MRILPASSAIVFGAEEEAFGDVDERRLRHPLLARHGIGIEDRPDRAAAVVAVADAGHRRVEEVVRVVGDVLRVEIAVRHVRLDRVVVVGGELLGPVSS